MVISALATLFVLVSLMLVGIILIQKPKGGGLIGAFGGAGGSAQSAFGSRTGDILTWVTVTLFALFLLLAITLTFVTRPPATTTGSNVTSTEEAPVDLGTGDGPATTAPATPAEEVPTTTQPVEK
jgi:preprotein translocase subunit SecG